MNPRAPEFVPRDVNPSLQPISTHLTKNDNNSSALNTLALHTVEDWDRIITGGTHGPRLDRRMKADMAKLIEVYKETTTDILYNPFLDRSNIKRIDSRYRTYSWGLSSPGALRQYNDLINGIMHNPALERNYSSFPSEWSTKDPETIQAYNEIAKGAPYDSTMDSRRPTHHTYPQEAASRIS